MSWQSIRQLRTDVSHYVLHTTRSSAETNGARWQRHPYGRLKRILRDGVLLATYAPRTTMAGNTRNTVVGVHPAVCFTEHPLSLLYRAARITNTTSTFGVAVRKDDLFEYGGRPVIYGDGSLARDLPPSLAYLWVNYDPTAVRDPAHGGHPIDWTHEREWRARPVASVNRRLGLSGPLAIPIHLPRDGKPPRAARFFIFVDTADRAKDLRRWIASAVPSIFAKSNYHATYAAALLEASQRIIPIRECAQRATLCHRVEDFAEQNPAWHSYLLHQRRVLRPYQDTPVHLCDRQHRSLCGLECVGRPFLGSIPVHLINGSGVPGLRLCEKCRRRSA
jgi:hypothetical protein